MTAQPTDSPRPVPHRPVPQVLSLRAALACSLLPLSAAKALPEPIERPNMVWITSEDNGPNLGCYGRELARTPNLDGLAARGFTYTNAFANAPICAPARVTLMTGRYATHLGLESMRSWYQTPEFDNYAQRFRMAGYYCTNNAKTDYNHDGYDPGYWNENSKTAHYSHRHPRQPFFHVWSSGASHEWNIWNTGGEPLRTDPGRVTVPPYLPDTPLIRRQLARGVDMMENADREIGVWLDELEEAGHLEDTIIFYYADHGGVLPRSKRFLYDTGTQVPLIVYIPEKFKHLWPGQPGSKIDDLVSFVDFAPTALNAAGLPVPEFMQGRPFLGKREKAGAEEIYLFMGRADNAVDALRGLRTPRHLYIRNFMPHRPKGAYGSFMYHQASYVEWLNLFRQGKLNAVQSEFFLPKAPEELYDIKADPWQIHNLAEDPEHQEVLGQLRTRLRQRMREVGDISLVSEIRREELQDHKPLRTAVDDGDIPIDRVIETADLAGWRNPSHLPELLVRLQDSDSSVVYWAATGLAALGKQAGPAKDALRRTLAHPSWEARIPAAEALYYLGERDAALPVLLEALRGSARVALSGANALYACDQFAPLTSADRDAIRPLIDLPRGQLRTQPAWAGFQQCGLTKELLQHIVTKKIEVKGMGANEVLSAQPQFPTP